MCWRPVIVQQLGVQSVGIGTVKLVGGFENLVNAERYRYSSFPPFAGDPMKRNTKILQTKINHFYMQTSCVEQEFSS